MGNGNNKIMVFISLLFCIVFCVCIVNTVCLPSERRIVGGVDAEKYSYQWMAAIMSKNKESQNYYYDHICGGALIAPNWILTAAHCVDSYNKDELYAVVGINDLKDIRQGEKVGILNIIPFYLYDGLEGDVALLELDKKLDIKPVELSFYSVDEIVGPAVILGWGIDYNYKGEIFWPNILQKADVQIISQQECFEFYKFEYVTDNMLCAGDLFGAKDACNGDSGGPLIVKKYGKDVLAGVTNWGIGCAKGYYGVYANVFNYSDFIDLNVGINKKNFVKSQILYDVDVDNNCVDLKSVVQLNPIYSGFKMNFWLFIDNHNGNEFLWYDFLNDQWSQKFVTNEYIFDYPDYLKIQSFIKLPVAGSYTVYTAIGKHFENKPVYLSEVDMNSILFVNFCEFEIE